MDSGFTRHNKYHQLAFKDKPRPKTSLPFLLDSMYRYHELDILQHQRDLQHGIAIVCAATNHGMIIMHKGGNKRYVDKVRAVSSINLVPSMQGMRHSCSPFGRPLQQQQSRLKSCAQAELTILPRSQITMLVDQRPAHATPGSIADIKLVIIFMVNAALACGFPE